MDAKWHLGRDVINEVYNQKLKKFYTIFGTKFYNY
jgi:hypothetical protein